ncbi:hypothetical protein [Clostridium merdae]|uniref:hypothetical protein n=1 Tax=Clostridium merdae TaxID=1958780 RepID=UPI000A2718A7|nr:hypothetical protein [Clostridium merdae]
MRRFLALFLSLCFALSGSVALAAESSQPSRMGGYVSIYDWINKNKDSEHVGNGGGASGGGASRFTSKDEYDRYVSSLRKTTISKSDVFRAWPATRGTDNANTLSDVYQEDFDLVHSYPTEETHVSVTKEQVLLLRYVSGSTGDHTFNYSFYFTVPVSGKYILSFAPNLTFGSNGSLTNRIYKNKPNGTVVFNDLALYPTDNGMHITDSLYFDANQVYCFYTAFHINKTSQSFQGACFVDIVADDYALAGAEDYGTRPSGYDGTLATPGDNPNYIDNSNVINGDVTTLHDYSTNTTYNITNWTYDYGDRTYNLTLEDGSTAVVVYGDDGITVNKGAITTEYKYWSPDGNSSGGNSSSSTPGEDNGGGSWSVIGEMLGKVFKGIADFLGAILGAIFGALTALLSVIVDGIGGLVKSLLSIFEQLPPLFAGFTAFLAAIFPYLPKEFTSLIILGMAAVIAAGLIRVLIKR